ncbi:MAG: phosphoribosylformylglycinamidine synthase I [Candidatus Gracilibacteria bacterium]
MPTPQALILTGYGINCEEETAYVFNKAGASSTIVHVNDLIDGHKHLSDYQILAIPGGFSYGDDTGAGNALSNRILNNLNEEILAFAKQDKLVIGICNGFQMLSNLGLVPATKEYGVREVALMWNTTARYECRWIHVKNESKKCVWTRDIDRLFIPVAHGEGNFYTTPEILQTLKDNDQIVFRYVMEDGSPADRVFPFNPNGALEDIAAITDPSGRILGMMPHPERFHCFTNHPYWTRIKEELKRKGEPLPEEGEGMKIFRNAVKYFA